MLLAVLSSFTAHPSEFIRRCQRMNITSDSATSPAHWTDEMAPSPFGTLTPSTFRNPQILFIRASHFSLPFVRVELQEYSLIILKDRASTSAKNLILHFLSAPRTVPSITTFFMALTLNRFFRPLRGLPAHLLCLHYGRLASSNLASATIQSRR